LVWCLSRNLDGFHHTHSDGNIHKAQVSLKQN
jgi:hypothetical protein